MAPRAGERREGARVGRGAAAAAQLVEDAGAARWIGLEVREQAEPIFRQERRGRPGQATRYLRCQRLRFDVEWSATAATIEYDARCDGCCGALSG